VLATVRRGEVLPFTKKTEDYYLVVVDGKKGWIKREAVREVEVPVRGADAPATEVPPGPAPAAIDKDTAGKVKRATVYLRVRLANGNTVEGSGFFAVQPGLVLTNAHVLGMLSPGSPMPAEVRVVVHSGEPEEFAVAAQVLGVDRERDLGVLRVQRRASRLPAPLPVDTSGALALVQKVYIFGFPFGTSLGKDITASESSVSSIRKDADGSAAEVQVNGGMHPGNSGGPVVDSRGVVVGVAVSVIRGTQLNFAVPGERVHELLRGRVSQVQFGEAFQEKDQARLPVRLSCLDPLQRIRTVKLEVWAGKASPARPPSPKEPRPLPGDRPRQSLAVAYQEGGGQVDVLLPSLAGGEVLWVRPVLTDAGGATRWAGAVAYTPSDLPPLRRTAALLQADFEGQPQRTVKLAGSFNTQVVSRGARQTLFRDAMEVEMLETARKESRGARLDLSIGAYRFTTTDVDGKSSPSSPQAQPFLRNRNLTFIVDPHGALLQRAVPILNGRFRPDVREDFTDLVHQIVNCYEMTCLVVPNREMEAQQTWQARLPLLLSYAGKKQIVEMVLTCTYEGRRLHRGQKYAVISLSGTIKGREPGRQSTAGTVTGTVHFSISDGYLSLANIKLESQSGYEGITVAHSVEVSLTRVRGNTPGIAAAPVGPVPAAPAAATATDYEQAVPYLRRRDFDQAIPLLEKAVAAQPNLAQAHSDLGFAYNEKRLFDQAIPHLKKAVELDPKRRIAHNNLGVAYNAKGLYDQAIACFKRALELDGDQAATHYNLGFAYTRKGLHDEAIPCYKRALELDPKRADTHNDLGFSYNAKGLYDDAIPCFQRALAVDPKHASALNNLGFAYNAKGLHDQGIPWLKKAVELYPKNAIALTNLGKALEEVGDLEQASDALGKVLALTPQTAPQFKPRKEALEEVEKLLSLERGLADVVKGGRMPGDFQEGLRLGKVCRVKQHYRAALRLYEQTFADHPDAAGKLAPINLTVLARVAVLVSEGKGSDPAPEADRAQYRVKALAWLRKFVRSQQEALEKDRKANRYPCQVNVRVLLQHRDLAPVRPPALNNLPAAERKEWDNFWDQVDALLEKAGGLMPDPSPEEKP
jgi:tetratricopeptide (TPR) repeat protein